MVKESMFSHLVYVLPKDIADNDCDVRIGKLGNWKIRANRMLNERLGGTL